MEPKLARWQIDIPTEREEELNRLMGECRISTKKDLFNNALTLLEWVVEELKLGRVLASVDEKSHKYRELRMPIFNSVISAGKQQKEHEAGRELEAMTASRS